MKEYKLKIDEFYNYNQYSVSMVFKVITTRLGDAEIIKKLAIDQIQTIILEGLSTTMGETYKALFGILASSPLEFYKHTTEMVDGIEYHYHQMAFSLLDKSNNLRANMTSALRQLNNKSIDVNSGTTVVPSIPSDVIIMVGGLSFDGRTCGTVLLPRRDEQLVKVVKQIARVNNNIAYKTSIKAGKTYMNHSFVRLYGEWYDNLLEAMNGNTNGTFIISQCDNLLPSFVASRLVTTGSGHRFENVYKNRVYADIVENTLVLYDGRGGYETIKPYIPFFSSHGVKLMVITQFASNRDLFFTPETRTFEPVNKTVFHFVNRDKLLLSNSKISIKSSGSMGGTIYFIPSLKQKRRRSSYNVSFNATNDAFRGEFVIPYDKENTQEGALAVIKSVYMAHRAGSFPETFKQLMIQYNNVLTNKPKEGEGDGEDILTRWFSYCTKSTADNDDKILQSYKRMKEQMEEEYKALGTYLAHFDFSKCMAVPKVIIDKKLKNNLYNTLHVESKNVIINSINNKKINPISEVQPTAKVKVDVRMGMERFMVWDEIPLKKFYDARTNIIELDYNKLKGAAIYDKIKSRR